MGAIGFFAADGWIRDRTLPLSPRVEAPINTSGLMNGREGDRACLEHVLHVNFGMYQHPTENRFFIAPDREPTLDLAVAVLHIGGLDDAVLPTPRLRHGDAAARRATGSGPGGQFLGSDMRAAYYPNGKMSGAGQSVGLMELVGYNPADVALYFQTYGPALKTKIEGIKTDSLPVICTTCDDSEQALDIEYAIAVAPGLKKVQVYVGSSPESVLNRMRATTRARSSREARRRL